MEAFYDREVFGASGGENDIGVTTYSVPYYARSLEECRTVAKGRIVDGLPEKSRTWQAHAGALFLVTVIYEGQKEPDDGEAPNIVRYSLKGSFEEEAIEANPDIHELMKKYDGRIVDGKRVEFPSTYTEKGGGGLTKDNAPPKKNPMFGVEKYKKFGIIWQRTYAAQRIPSSVVLRVGKVVDTPPGAPPELEGRTKWLVMEPSAEGRGNVWEITEQYQLLDAEVPDLLRSPEGK